MVLVTSLNTIWISILSKFMYRFNKTCNSQGFIIVSGDPHLLISILFCNALPYHTSTGLCDQQNTIKVIAYHFRGYIIKGCSLHLDHFLSLFLSWLTCSEGCKLPCLLSTQEPLQKAQTTVSLIGGGQSSLSKEYECSPS